MAGFIVLIVGIAAFFVARNRERRIKRNELNEVLANRNEEPPEPPIDARTLRHFVPPGTSLTDYVIPCPDCGWNTAVSLAWVLENDRFVCSRCHAGTRLIKTERGGPGSIVAEYQRRAAPPPMPDPITHTNVDEALRHLAKTYGSHPETHAHDEEDGPAPPLVKAIPKKRGRPRKLVPQTEPQPVAAKGARQHQSVLATGLRFPATIAYGGGHHANIPRDVIILQVMGFHVGDGTFDVRCVRCVCNLVKAFRAFKVDRITELIDGETGEVVPDARAWLNRKLAALV